MKLEINNSMFGYEALVALYLDWRNGFISYQSFAYHHGITEEHAKQIIELGRYYSENGSVHH
jgi:hypothetical protein